MRYRSPRHRLELPYRDDIPRPAATRVRHTLRTLSRQFIINQTVAGAGWNTGYGPLNGGWSVQQAAQLNHNVLTRGIAGVVEIVASKLAAGDFAGIYSYIYGIAGLLSGSDEGVTGNTTQIVEISIGGTFTVTSTSGTGDTAPVLSTSNGAQCADMTLLLNLSKGTLAGSLNGPSTPFGATFINQLPVAGITLPLTTAWGTCASVVYPPGLTQDVGQSVTLTMTLGTIGAVTQPFVPGHVSIAGDAFPEQAVITAVGPVTSGTQTITLLLRYGNTKFVVFQGGIAGQCISSDANLAFTGVRSSYRAFGSLTGSDMIYAVYVPGGCTGVTIPQAGAEVFSTSGTNAGFHLFPYAEVVKNATTTATGNLPVLEPNTVPWASGDTVYNAYGPYFGGHSGWFTKFQNSPTYPPVGSIGLEVRVDGNGVATSQFELLRLVNAHYVNNSTANQQAYRNAGGPLTPPTAVFIGGIHGNTFVIDIAPSSQFGEAIITVNNLANYNGDHGVIRLFNLPLRQPITWSPTNGTVGVEQLSASGSIQANGPINSNGTVSGYFVNANSMNVLTMSAREVLSLPHTSMLVTCRPSITLPTFKIP